MTPTHVFYAMLVVLTVPVAVERSATLLRSRPIIAALIVVGLVGALLLPLATQANGALLVITVVVTIAANAVAIKVVKNRNLARTITMVINVTVAVFAVGHPAVSTGFNATALRLAHLFGTNPLIAAVNAQRFHLAILALTGSYLAAVEVNHPIALFLKGANLMPAPTADPQTNEPARGKIIGYLERVIVFILVLTANVNAVGFV